MPTSQVCRLLAAAASVLCLTLAAPIARADQPSITLFEPPGFQIGQEVELVIQGVRLGDVKELLLYDTGVEVVSLSAADDKKVVAKLKVAEDCQPGLHALRLATESGISNLRYFGVSPLKQASEVEPNSDFASPQALEMNTTLNGIVKTEDVDYFAVQLEAGQSVTVELEGLRLGTEFFDPFVAILDENRFELARSDDAPLLQQDCLCAYRAEAAGTYIIEVRESAFGGNDRCQYRLHVGDFPRPVAITPAGGRPGEVLQATVVDANGDTWQETIAIPEDADALRSGEFDYVANREGKLAPSPNKLRVVDLPNVLEQEPDTDKAALAVVDAPVALNGVLQEPGDIDWFKIRGKKDQTLEFTVFGRRVLRSPLDSWLEIHKATGGRLAANDDAGGPDSTQAFKFPEDGEYLVAIRDQLSEGGPLYAYRIEVAPAQRSVALAIDELQRYESQTMEVPQGGQMAVLLRANRKGFGGDLGLRLEGLPAGIEVVTPSVAANESYIPFMLKAAIDAQPDAALSPFIAETLPDGPGVSGTLDQRTMLVRGQNNRDMWGHSTGKLAVAVTKKLPFSIELVQPEVPIVRNGSSHYLVRARRDAEYKDVIYLRVLYNPSGLSASGSIRIDADKSEALIPVTANSKAVIGKFPVVVLARAKASNASVWSASEFITLEVADSFFDFKFGTTVAETGSSANIAVGVEQKSPPEGTVELEIVGLPAGVTCEQPKLAWTEGTQQVSFPITIAADARVGQFKTIYVKSTITRPGGTIVQTEGRGELQLAAPMAKPTQIADSGAAKPAPAAEKPLSRLEQLRQAKALLKDPR